MNDKSKSRKWSLVLLVFWVSVILVSIPPLVSSWIFKMASPVIILTGTEFTSLLTLIVSGYMGFNVFQKHVETKNGKVQNSGESNVVNSNENEDDGKEA